MIVSRDSDILKVRVKKELTEEFSSFLWIGEDSGVDRENDGSLI